MAEVLFRYPEKEFSLSDLAKEAGVAKANIGKILDDLNKMGFLEIIKLTKIWRIKAKQDSWNFTKSKFVEKAIYMAMLGMIYSSKGLYNLNPNIERKVIHPLYYSVRRNKYYLKNRTY